MEFQTDHYKAKEDKCFSVSQRMLNKLNAHKNGIPRILMSFYCSHQISNEMAFLSRREVVRSSPDNLFCNKLFTHVCFYIFVTDDLHSPNFIPNKYLMYVFSCLIQKHDNYDHVSMLNLPTLSRSLSHFEASSFLTPCSLQITSSSAVVTSAGIFVEEPAMYTAAPVSNKFQTLALCSFILCCIYTF